ncbi:hypothetical protein [Actinomadura latina]|uniref:Secreted protein n=1 Tax=Actinomadura latina TaxID=163603 RepID=A0A846YQE3_9ACTN|nr:hypothetical protein [Actinomadura latina]NKZ02371.1 hypothetical protein [Actinomadura latina]
MIISRRRTAVAGGLAAAAIVPGAALMSGAALTSGAPTVSAAPAAAHSTVWRPYQTPVREDASLTSVAATGRDNAWAAGFTVPDTVPESAGRSARAPQRAEMRESLSAEECWSADSFPSLMLRWDGRAWRNIAVPRLGRINSVSATRRNDAWAAADCGLSHWNGRTWAAAPYAAVPGAQQTAVGAVASSGPDNTWLVGDFSSGGRFGSFVQRWDGRRWTNIPLPALGMGDDFSLKTVDVRGPVDVWAVGVDYSGNDRHPERLILLHWNGRSWERLAEPASDQWTKRPASVRILASNDVWVTGWTKLRPDGDEPRHPLMLHWDGRAWGTAAFPDGQGELSGLTRWSGGLLAVGDTFSPASPSYGMYALRWNGERWTRDTVPAQGTGSLSSVAAVPGGGVWTVGAVGDDPHPRAFIARRE